MLEFLSFLFCNALIISIILFYFFRKWRSIPTRKVTLAKIAPDFARFHRCKITHFSQISQAFCSFSSFAKNKQHPILSKFTQIAHYETFTGIPFFANDFAPFGFVSISQRTTKGQLNHCNFHWLFLLNRRNVLYAGIAFRAERIDVYPILFPHYQFG